MKHDTDRNGCDLGSLPDCILGDSTLTVKQNIKAAFRSLNKFSRTDIECALDASYERICELEDALKHIKKTARGNADGSISIEPFSYHGSHDLNKFIEWALKDE